MDRARNWCGCGDVDDALIIKKEARMKEILSADEKNLRELRRKMDETERYSETWFQLKTKYQKLFEKIERQRR